MSKQGGVLDANMVEQAQRTAKTAAARAGVTVIELADQTDLRAAAELLAEVWGTGPDFAPISPELLRALVHTNNYVAGVRHEARLVGASVGFLADGGGAYKLHSHITGLYPATQLHGIGFALKLHQRAWALRHDLPVIAWTFDPLVRRNAFFNLTKLGAEATGFYTDFYGAMKDRLNAEDQSDRCEITWDLRSRRAEAASEQTNPRFEVEALLDDGAVAVLEDDGAGRPRTRALTGDVRLLWVPPDIMALRSADPGTARSWRHALRDTLGASIHEGFVASDMTRSGWYVLRRLA